MPYCIRCWRDLENKEKRGYYKGKWYCQEHYELKKGKIEVIIGND